MPVSAQPKPKPPVPPNAIKIAGTQEQFQAAGDALAKALGWVGEPELEANGISVQDAWNYLVKSLHESFQAGALGHEPRDHMTVCDHLRLVAKAPDSAPDDVKALVASFTNDRKAEILVEQGLVKDALAKAYEEGKGADVTAVPQKIVSAAASLVHTGKVG